MIFGIGTDIVDIRRIEKLISRSSSKSFLKKYFDQSELEFAAKFMNDGCEYAAKIAKIWAAKESVVKSFGTGFIKNIRPIDIVIRRDNLGRPFVVPSPSLSQKITADIVGGRGFKIHLSLSDDYPFATAFAILEV